MAIRKKRSNCMVKAVTLALNQPQLSDFLWSLRSLQMESGRAISSDTDLEAKNLARLFQAAGEPSMVIPMKVKSLRGLAVLQGGDQLFVGLPKEVAGKPHLVYVGQAGDDNILNRELIRQQLPDDIASGFTFHLLKLAASKDGLQLFVRKR